MRATQTTRIASLLLVFTALGCNAKTPTAPDANKEAALNSPEVSMRDGNPSAGPDSSAAGQRSASPASAESSTLTLQPERATTSDESHSESTGATFHVTPTGVGRQDGSDWQNAASQSQLSDFLSGEVKPGDRVLLASGDYRMMSLAKGGTADRPVTILGADTGEGLPSIAGKWRETNVKYHAHSWSAISLAAGAAHLRIGGLRISGHMHGIVARNNHHVELFDLSIQRCREGILLTGVYNSEIHDCEIVQYTKRGIRFDAGCHDLNIARVTADAMAGSDAWPTEGFPFGFAVEDGDGNHSIRFEGCTERNNIFAGKPGEYWNGDGFVAENNAENLSYHDCQSLDNTDGGWDDKSLPPEFVNCVAARNKRGFRVWNSRGDLQHPARLENCLSVYNRSRGGTGSSVGLWLVGAVETERCTFHNNGTAAIGIENQRSGAGLVAKNCIFSTDQPGRSEALVLREGGTQYRAESVVEWSAGDRDQSPDYIAPSETWNGDPAHAFNSQRYGPNQGFPLGKSK